MFYEVIPHVLTYLFPVYKKTLLFYLVLHPMKSHIHCLGPFLTGGSGNDTFISGVICFDWGWWLGKIEFIESNAEGYSCLPIVEKSTDFCFT